jgi:hypothetical protein
VGVRAGKQACGLVIGSSGGNAAAATGYAPAGCADALSSLNDQGDLNYSGATASPPTSRDPSYCSTCRKT